MLGQFEAQYAALPDKRRKPGPKLRKIINMMKDGAPGGEVRKVAKELYDEMSDAPDLFDFAGQLLQAFN